MENSKTRKPRTIQMKYPAPYSHSWSSTEPLQNVKGKMKKSPSFQENRQRGIHPQCCWSRPNPINRGCDPYAPHLKYGVFPKKTRRNTNIQLTEKQPEMESIEINENNLLIGEKKRNKKADLSETPLFVIRPIDKRFTRHLSSSGVMHFDIQPQLAGKLLKYNNTSPKLNSTDRVMRNKNHLI